MLDAETLRRVTLSRRPFGQRFVAWVYLWPNFSLPPKLEIVVEGLEKIPDRPVILAMNHTDRYNYWPFQYFMYMKAGLPRFTATWVKGKYYENRFVARFLMSTNNIPVPSRGYIISTRFRKHLGRPPNEDEYRLLRDLADGRVTPEDAQSVGEVADFFSRYGGGAVGALAAFEDEFGAVMGEVVRLNQDAMFKHNCHVLVFPEGTRSLHLSRGRTGMAQMAQHLGATIVPVGCNGSAKVYPGGSPWARGGRIVYRIGDPLEPYGPELKPHRVTAPFIPLTRQAVACHEDKFQAVTDVVMDRINGLLDPDYQRQESLDSDGVQGVSRFL